MIGVQQIIARAIEFRRDVLTEKAVNPVIFNVMPKGRFILSSLPFHSNG